MSSPPAANNPQNLNHFKSFVSENELEEKRRRRQEEWEKVRSADQPIEAPEEEYDPRSLYERLQEQKDKKQAEFEEAHRLRNMIKGLDNDEVQFLDLVDKTKEEMEAKRLQEEGKEIEEYRKAVANMAEEAEGQKLLEIKNSASCTSLASTTTASSSQRRSQQSLLAGAVKRKSTEKQETGEKRSKLNEFGDITGATEEHNGGASVDTKVGNAVDDGIIPTQNLACLGVLPGLGVYSDSSDSENSTDSEIETSNHYDLLGRPRWHGHTHADAHQQHSSKA